MKNNEEKIGKIKKGMDETGSIDKKKNRSNSRAGTETNGRNG